MPTSLDPETRRTLDELLQTDGLDRATRLYRSTRTEFLQPASAPGEFALSANPESPEAIVDLYRGGHIVVADQAGPGLAFAERADHQWHGEDRMQVEVRLEDVLAQGGLVYPVESVVTEKVWYVTLPAGSIRAREARA